MTTNQIGLLQSSILSAPHSIETIRCHYSGVPLAHLVVLIHEGRSGYIGEHRDAIYVHPFYQLSQSILMHKMQESLREAQELEWNLTETQQNRLRLLTSALMHNLDCIRQDSPCLPPYAVALASAPRLFKLAKWFFFISSQRLEFPIFSISKRNGNLDWNNFKYWLDAAFEIRADWAVKSRKYEQADKLRIQTENVQAIRSEHYKRVDVKKVWNWIELQLAGNVPSGRIATFKTLFLSGDLEAHEWLTDDIDDLQVALVEYCDCGNEIMHYINKRLNGIRNLIRAFYSGFTLLNAVGNEATDGSEQTEKEVEFLGDFDRQAAMMESLPQPPIRSEFATTALFLKANAQHSILKKRWELLQKRDTMKKVEAASSVASPAPSETQAILGTDISSDL